VNWAAFFIAPPAAVLLQMPLPELRRHKRSFLRLATNNTLNRLKDAQVARRMFVDYLRDQLAAT
jgi:protein KTI12